MATKVTDAEWAVAKRTTTPLINNARRAIEDAQVALYRANVALDEAAVGVPGAREGLTQFSIAVGELRCGFAERVQRPFDQALLLEAMETTQRATRRKEG